MRYDGPGWRGCVLLGLAGLLLAIGLAGAVHGCQMAVDCRARGGVPVNNGVDCIDAVRK